MRKDWKHLLLLLALMGPLIFPLVRPGFFLSDDGEWMVIRLAAFHQSLRAGQFPVRFLETLNHGYGYPVPDFLYPLPFYAGEFFHLLRFSFSDSVKILFLLSMVLSAVTMYELAKKEWGRWPGVAAAVFYVWAPYRIFDIYSRGSLGESFAFIFPPLVFLFLIRAFETKQMKFSSLAALSYAALICSHNTIAFLFTPVIFLFIVLKIFQSKFSKEHIVNSLLFGLLSLSASSWFWFPAIYDLRFTKMAAITVADFNNYFVDGQNWFSLIGPGMLLIILTSTVLIGIRKEWKMLFLLGTALFGLFLTTSFSGVFWQTGIFPKLVQFPWRFLSVAVFAVGLLLAYLLHGGKQPIMALAAIFLMVVVSWPVLKVNPVVRDESFYLTNDDTTTVKGEYMPKWITENPQNRPPEKIEILSGEGSAFSIDRLSMKTAGKVRINTVFFPGIKVYLDNKETGFYYKDGGLPTLLVSAGQHTLETKFTETWWRLAADLVSLVGLSLSMLLIFIKRLWRS